jgi:hypothetical protein
MFFHRIWWIWWFSWFYRFPHSQAYSVENSKISVFCVFGAFFVFSCFWVSTDDDALTLCFYSVRFALLLFSLGFGHFCWFFQAQVSLLVFGGPLLRLATLDFTFIALWCKYAMNLFRWVFGDFWWFSKDFQLSNFHGFSMISAVVSLFTRPN